jgi:tetratricopeptide (TPR) repeat protein
LQWCDQDTLEWLHFLLRFDAQARLLLVGTARLDEVGPRHPLTTLLDGLRAGARLTELGLGPLDAADTAELAVRVAGRILKPEQTQRVFVETEGQPLFVVETARALVGESVQGPLSDAPLAAASGTRGRIPPKVHAVIAARLAQLSDSTREIVRLAATIGRSFTLELLIDASAGEMDVVVDAIDELAQRRIVREQGNSAYDFSHDRIREVAYTDMSAARRAMLHLSVAQALERGSGASVDAVSAQVAAHYEQAGAPTKAIPYYRRAAERAQRVHAHHEAIHLLRKGLGLLAHLPSTEDRHAQELLLQTALGASLVDTIGYAAPPVVAAYRRAQELCEPLAQPASPPVLRALAIASISHAQFDDGLKVGQQLVRLASERAGPMLDVEGHYVLGVTLFWKGALLASREHLEHALAHYPASGLTDHLSLYAQDPRVVCLSRLAIDLWLLGEPTEARATMTRAVELARDVGHPFSLAYALSWGVYLAILERDAALALADSVAGEAVCAEHGMDLWLGPLAVGRGWALAERGDVLAGLAAIRAGMAATRPRAVAFNCRGTWACRPSNTPGLAKPSQPS